MTDTVILQSVAGRGRRLEDFVAEVQDWPVDGVAFTFYVPTQNDATGLGWDDLRDRDPNVERVIALQRRYPEVVKANVAALELIKSEISLETTGVNGEGCICAACCRSTWARVGRSSAPSGCDGNDVDCSRCGAYGVFNAAYHRA